MRVLLLLVLLTTILIDTKIDGALWNETYPKGTVIRLSNNLDVYSVGQSNKNLSIIVIYDIYGFNVSQTRVFCDRLAYEYSVHVVMPDVYHGTAVPETGNRTEWMNKVNNWTSISNDLQTVTDWLENSSSAIQIGIIGFCWGGLQVVRACSNLSDTFITGISIHGAQINADTVKDLKRPMLFIAAGNDPALEPNVSNAIEQLNPTLSQQCEYKTYDNMRHGFVAAGANYSNPDNVIAIDDVHWRVRNFLTKITTNNSSINSTTNNNSINLTTNFYFVLIFILFSFHLYL